MAMVRFLLKRVLYIIIVLFILSFIIFMIFRTAPGDPVDIFFPIEEQIGMRPELVQQRRQEIIDTMGLDHPHVIQYFYWLAAVFRGNFGFSMESRRPVLEHIRDPMINTIVMNVISMIIVFAITIPVGVRSAVKRGKFFDNTALVTSMVGISIPAFLLSLLLIVFLSILLPWNIFPMFGMASISPPESGTLAWYLDRLRYMALPLMALVFTSMAGMIRYVRSAMIDALGMDCVRTARSKGLSEKVVVYVHAFRNALIPVITIMGGWFIMLFGGSMAIEIAFQWQGMGVIMLNALNNNDIGVQMAMGVFYALVAYIVILLLDIIYVMVDPRIRLEG